MGLLRDGGKPLNGQTISYLGFSDFNSKKLMRMQTVAESKEIPNLNETYTHTTTTNQPVNNSNLHNYLNHILEIYFREKIEKKIRMIFIPNPNNPTGSYLTASEIKNFLENLRNEKDLFIVFDEAYHEFVRAKDYESLMDRVDNQCHFAVIRTFSKSLGCITPSPVSGTYLNSGTSTSAFFGSFAPLAASCARYAMASTSYAAAAL